MNLGLIGLGSIGKIHLKNCLRLKNALLISVADPSKRALQFAREAGIKNVQTDYNELLNDKTIDAVIISVPNFLHSECAQNAAEAGKDIFLEKPLARSVAEGKQILAHVRRNGVKLMVGYPSRFVEEFIKLKNKIEDGVLGDIQMAYATNISKGPFSQRGEVGRPVPVPSWWFNRELMGGGALLDLGVHGISLFKWYFGEVVDAKSYLGYKFNMDFEDHALCFLRFKEGPLATVIVGWFSEVSRVNVKLYGTVSYVSVIRSSASVFNTILDDVRRKLGKIERSMNPYYKELQFFVECLNSDATPRPSGEEALQDLEIISMAYKNSFQLLDRLE